MKKRLLSMLAAVAMVLTLLPVSVFAEGEEPVTPVAQIVGGASYATLEAAFAAAESGATIKLLRDTSTSVITLLGKTLILDLNGFTLSSSGASDRIFTIGGKDAKNKSMLTVKTSEEGGNITIDGTTMMFALRGTDAQPAELVLESGEYTSLDLTNAPIVVSISGGANNASEDRAVFTLNKDAVINIPYIRQDLQSMDDWGGYAIAVQGWGASPKVSSGVVVNINGTINAGNNGGFYVNGNIDTTTGNIPQINIGSTANITGISYLAGYAETTVESGASITGYNAIGIKSGKLTINGGTIHGTGDAYVPTPGYSNGIYGSGAGIQIESHAGYAGNIELNINSGTIKSDNAPAVYEYNNVSGDADTSLGEFNISGGNFAGNKTYGDIYTSNSAKAKAEITGGNYVNDPTAYLDANHVAVALANSDSGYNYVVTKAAEITEGAPEVTVSDGIDVEKKDDADAFVSAIQSGTVSTDGAIADILAGLAEDNEIEVTGNQIDGFITDLKKLEHFEDTTIETSNLVIVYEPYLDIELKDINLDPNLEEGETIIELDISAYYNVLATTGDVVKDVNDGKAILEVGTNAVKLDDAEKMTVKTRVPVTLPISKDIYDRIVESAIFIKHTKDAEGGRDRDVYIYEASVSAGDNNDYYLSFVSLNGFSKIELFADNSLARINYQTSDANAYDATDLGIEANPATYNVSDINSTLPKVTPPSGYLFSGWKFAGVEDKNAVYKKIEETLYYELAALCEIDDGEAVAIIATPVFTEKSYGSGSSTTNYTITIKAGEDGIVSPADKATVKEGNDLTIKITPNDGYVVDDIIVDGKSVGAAKTYTFKNVQENHTIEVTFKLAMTDVTPGGWPYDEIKYVIDSGLMDGIGGDEFAPDSTVTRAMLVTVLWRLEKQPANNGENPFTDLTQDWYKDAVIWAAENDIVNGYGDGRFGPSDILTREQMVTIIYRYANYVDIDVSGENDLSAFDDAESVNEYAENAMQWAVESGLIKGRAPTTLAPQGNSTRAELATVIMRFIENILK